MSKLKWTNVRFFVMAAIAFCFSSSLHAASTGSISFTGGLNNIPATCEAAELAYDFGVTPTNDDTGGNDYIAIVTVDADGTPLDADFLSYPVAGGPVTGSAGGGLGFIEKVVYRPVTIALFDISDPGSLDEDSQDGYDFAVSGVFLTEASIDQATVTSLCDGLPLRSAAYTFITGTGPSGSTRAVPVLTPVMLLFMAILLAALGIFRLKSRN